MLNLGPRINYYQLRIIEYQLRIIRSALVGCGPREHLREQPHTLQGSGPLGGRVVPAGAHDAGHAAGRG